MTKLKRNILLNPGPATTTDTVKFAQVVPDICPREREFCNVINEVSLELTSLVANTEEYSTVLFGGSGTAAVESILSSVANDGVIIIINNGLYGVRMCEIAEAYSLDWVEFQSPYDCAINIKELREFILNFPRKVSYLAVVHNETTTGLLNDIEKIGKICREQNIEMIVDAMSSYAAIPIQMKKMNISFLAASSNKNLQGMAGVSFVIAKTIELQKQKEVKPSNYYLNLYSQFQTFTETGQMRFTPPVQTIYALKQAILELKEEGIDERYKRYSELWEILVAGLSRLGLTHLISKKNHSKIITAILEPDCTAYNFNHMHDYFYNYGITIYPGKLNNLNSFRIANIGDLTIEDMEVFLRLLESYLQEIGYFYKKGVSDHGEME
ncbi:2-aminoethylphosphonate-pyruvate transaminase [Bacillus mesophilus]|uniref:2-aminoethylphosphonate--pyruvate transaminase n=1 Tax=Bacillus mesophilus TaxID=1808955 RepID=A0A6M0Q8H0_9BACI|nr:2-aminoethylphosphonate--pyruvate transaminase [Bacillus mesophilus]MBM7661366.1 2-aminoethylphosphonate-pyruvate transaminase [Bacillus mesophilus]NEY72039.1 2-aminoethylphosphonate--pyruvate transaminase [Bacillus mesophilus]